MLRGGGWAGVFVFSRNMCFGPFAWCVCVCVCTTSNESYYFNQHVRRKQKRYELPKNKAKENNARKTATKFPVVRMSHDPHHRLFPRRRSVPRRENRTATRSRPPALGATSSLGPTNRPNPVSKTETALYTLIVSSSLPASTATISHQSPDRYPKHQTTQNARALTIARVLPRPRDRTPPDPAA